MSDPTQQLLAIARGQLPGYSYVTKFGRNGDIDTGSDPEDVWAAGGLYTGQPAHSDAAETMEITGGAADDVAGTGALTVSISGLDASWVYQSETIVMTGATEVVTTSTWRRLNRIKVLTAGSGGANSGVITATGSDSSAVYATVAVGKNQTQITAYTVPAGYEGSVIAVYAGLARASGAAGSAELTFRCRAEGGVYNTLINDDVTNSRTLDLDVTNMIPMPLAAKTDVLMRVESVSDNNTIIASQLGILLAVV